MRRPHLPLLLVGAALAVEGRPHVARAESSAPVEAPGASRPRHGRARPAPRPDRRDPRHAGGIPPARYPDGRDYRFGPGEQALVAVRIHAGDRATAGISLRQYLLFVTLGGSGSELAAERRLGFEPPCRIVSTHGNGQRSVPTGGDR